MTQPFLNDTPITTASDQVFVDMRREIVEGSIQQGSKISEPELAKRYGVSRATLREALNRLESCYLVERKANVGCRVVALTAERLIEVYQVRSSLEGLACRLAADNMAADEVKGLKQLLNQHLKTQRVKEGESYYQEAGDLDFHYRIIKGSKNAHLIHLLCNELSKRLSASLSRATLREALNRLESCYLVERKANVGCRVVALTAERLIEVYQVRSSLEGLACRLAADNMAADEVKGLKQLLNQHLKTQRVKEGESYYQEAGDLDFHYRIIKGSKNAHLIHLLCNELYQLIRMYRVQMGMVGPRVSKAFDEHLAIINAIENHDGELAEMLMKRHISASQANIQTKFDVYQSI